ncbi:ABC transporter [Xaviernesmea oryzae]|uniref:ABC transporter n=1 Tax=Xaviernesmea oryzae TaxID=464029 RepID=A0A1Q9B3E9_9HYPH|nr:zinc ABC transporter ATP-binding protein AztA [Xaviernesmea oryzae]OLP62576.1 ABC transporter [Xaviernesmea oryzae]SEM18866.1 zinc/manganese transport system ATP-binding protein [Xaviernesmea oryzae]
MSQHAHIHSAPKRTKDADAALTFENLTLGYGDHAAVHHLDGTVPRGALMAVVGANGSGKSTLLKAVAGLLRPMSGRIARAPALRLAYLAQQAEIDRSFPARVFDLVSLGLWPKRGLLGRLRQADRADIATALSAVGLDGFSERAIDSLSGGQLQRALFARVLLQDADLILLDEPFNAIDAKTVRDLVALIQRWHGEERTVIAVMHDLALVRETFPQTLLLARRAVAWGETAHCLSAENLLKARNFAEAFDDTAPWCRSESA